MALFRDLKKGDYKTERHIAGRRVTASSLRLSFAFYHTKHWTLQVALGASTEYRNAIQLNSTLYSDIPFGIKAVVV
jgi:hypothetical protein